MDNPIYRAIDILTLQRCAEEADAVSDLLDEAESLRAVVRECVGVLALVVSPEAIKSSSPSQAYFAAVAAEAKARAALKENEDG